MSILSEDEHKWAFGRDSGLQFKSMPSLWNELHPDLFTISVDDAIYKTEPRIKAAYAERVIA